MAMPVSAITVRTSAKSTSLALSEGNVFRYLYKVNVGDTVDVWDDQDHEHEFHVVDVRLVPPDDLSPMAQTRDPTLTLITCGGTFDPTGLAV